MPFPGLCPKQFPHWYSPMLLLHVASLELHGSQNSSSSALPALMCLDDRDDCWVAALNLPFRYIPLSPRACPSLSSILGLRWNPCVSLPCSSWDSLQKSTESRPMANIGPSGSTVPSAMSHRLSFLVKLTGLNTAYFLTFPCMLGIPKWTPHPSSVYAPS